MFVFCNVSRHFEIVKLSYIKFFESFFFFLKVDLDINKNIYNPGQNIWHKVKKASKIGQNFKNLLSNFTFFDSYCQSLIFGRKGGP